MADLTERTDIPGNLAGITGPDDLTERGLSQPLIPRTSVAAATWALFLGLGLVMVGNGLNGALLGVRSATEGFGTTVTGVIMASYFAGFLAGTAYTETALRTVGHIRVFAALASLASSVVLVQAVSVEPLTWAITRFLFGACMAGLYVVVESWLNDLATNATRGRILSVYMIVSMGGVAAGQLLLNVEDTSGFTLFIIVSVLVSLSLVPVTLSASSAPPIAVPESTSLRDLIGRVPTGLTASFFSGASAGALLGMAAVYASQIGLDAGRISVVPGRPDGGCAAVPMANRLVVRQAASARRAVRGRCCRRGRATLGVGGERDIAGLDPRRWWCSAARCSPSTA